MTTYMRMCNLNANTNMNVVMTTIIILNMTNSVLIKGGLPTGGTDGFIHTN